MALVSFTVSDPGKKGTIIRGRSREIEDDFKRKERAELGDVAVETFVTVIDELGRPKAHKIVPAPRVAGAWICLKYVGIALVTAAALTLATALTTFISGIGAVATPWALLAALISLALGTLILWFYSWKTDLNP